MSTHPLLFSTSSGHIGALPRHWVYTEGEGEEGVKEKNNNVVQQDNEPGSETDDQLFDDSLLLEVMYTNCTVCINVYTDCTVCISVLLVWTRDWISNISNILF